MLQLLLWMQITLFTGKYACVLKCWHVELVGDFEALILLVRRYASNLALVLLVRMYANNLAICYSLYII